MKNVYIARQPIMDKEEQIFAYELLYRDVEQKSSVEDGRYATASVINNLLNKFGTQAILGGRKAFVKIDQKFLMNDLIFSVPKEFFIFSLLESIEMDERVYERIEQLYYKGYELCLNDTTCSLEYLKSYQAAFGFFKYVKINIPAHLPASDMRECIAGLKKEGLAVIGTRIEEKSHQQVAKELGCEYFQGFFFAKPNIIENKELDASQLSIIRLYNLLMQDTNIDEIASEFEKNYAISVQLLQFINSGAFAFRKRISSIHHVLVLVGRIPLAQWLMLMIYSKSVTKTEESSPLILLIKERTELMQNLLKKIEPNVRSNKLGEAYFVGVLSLLNVVFGVSLEQLLEHLYISDEVKDALLHDRGDLGELYALVREIEQFNTDAIEVFAKKHGLDANDINGVVAQCIEDVNRFEMRETK
ncbi:MAG: EAL domain-containing protein [Sulfurimonas sp.]|jgi:EAL and modified HD-GYP domain-containing signal transduction protein|nr:EAL domain-containing protein [Sulfurimonas sp.]